MSHAQDCILAIDLGTSGCKAALVSLTGKVLAWESRKVETIILPNGGAEQDPDAWWGAITESIRALMDRGVVTPSAIKAVCANTQGEGTVPVDESGRHLCNAILWMDTRGESHVRRAVGGPLAVLGYSVPKLLRYLRLTGGAPSLTGKDPAGHMLFVKNERPEIYARTDKFLSVLDYINFRMTGRMAAAFDMSVTSWVTDNRASGALKYDDSLCSILGIPREKFASLVPCTEILGELTQEFAAATGLAQGTVVVAGAMDTSAAAIGSGAVRDGDLHLYLGTSSWLGAHVPYKKTAIFSAIASIPCAIPGKYLMTALQATAGGNITFLRDRILYPDDALREKECPADFFERVENLIVSSPPGSRGIIYTPWIYGERAPVEDHTIRAGFHNISLEHTRADLVRAVHEGVAMNTRWLLAPVEKFLGRRVESIAAVGGGACSAQWCQIFADVMGRPIRQIENPIEANVRGSAFIAGVALGRMNFADVADLVGVTKTYEPRAETRRVYDTHFAEFVKLYHAQKKSSQRLRSFHAQSRAAGAKE